MWLFVISGRLHKDVCISQSPTDSIVLKPIMNMLTFESAPNSSKLDHNQIIIWNTDIWAQNWLAGTDPTVSVIQGARNQQNPFPQHLYLAMRQY